jgi:hypothetical protein
VIASGVLCERRLVNVRVRVGVVVLVALAAACSDSRPSASPSSGSDRATRESSATSALSTSTITTSSESTGEVTVVLSRADFGASLEIPLSWKDTPGNGAPSAVIERDGTTGYTYISTGYTVQYGGPAVADKLVGACHDEAFHVVKPYGSAPRVTMGVVDGHRACFIAPSTDAPRDIRRANGPQFVSAAVFIAYSSPSTIEPPMSRMQAWRSSVMSTTFKRSHRPSTS